MVDTKDPPKTLMKAVFCSSAVIYCLSFLAVFPIHVFVQLITHSLHSFVNLNFK